VGVVRRCAKNETSRTARRRSAEHSCFVFDLELSVRLLKPPRAVVKFIDLLFQIAEALFENGAADDQVANEPRKFVEPSERYADDRPRAAHLLRSFVVGRFGMGGGGRFAKTAYGHRF